MWRRIGYLPALTGSIVAMLAVAGPADACEPGTLACTNAGSSQGDGHGNINAAAEAQPSVDVRVTGGDYPSRTARVSIPARVLPPCYYSMSRSGAQMARDSVDPYYRALAHRTGERYQDWFPADTAKHAAENGNWYSWSCSSESFGSNLAAFNAFVDQWAAANPPYQWVAAGAQPPTPPVPPAILEGIARQAMERAVRQPLVHFSPATRTVVNLDTWLWFEPAAWHPISATASAGGVSVTVAAAPATVSVSGLPGDSTADTTCTGGGRPWTADASTTDCWIRFGRSSAHQPEQKWAFTVSIGWTVTSQGAPLIGPPTITTSGDEALQARETQILSSGN